MIWTGGNIVGGWMAVTVYVDYGAFGLPEASFMRPGLVITRKFIGALTTDDFSSMPVIQMHRPARAIEATARR